jgi:hypothetical protein
MMKIFAASLLLVALSVPAFAGTGYHHHRHHRHHHHRPA